MSRLRKSGLGLQIFDYWLIYNILKAYFHPIIGKGGDLLALNNLRAYRIKKLMTQKDLAKASGVSQVTISFIENGLSEPLDLTKQKLSRALKIEPEKLFPPRMTKKGTRVSF